MDDLWRTDPTSTKNPTPMHLLCCCWGTAPAPLSTAGAASAADPYQHVGTVLVNVTSTKSLLYSTL